MNHKILNCLSLVVAAWISASGSLVFAQAKGGQKTQCEGPEDNRPADAAIEACTALIQSSVQTPDILSVAFERRGFAYLDRSVALQGRGTAYLVAADHAIADLSEAIRLKPDFEHAMFLRGNASYIKQDYDRAIADYRNAIDLNPNDMQAFNNLATVYLVRRDNDNAIAVFDEAIRLHPNYAIAFNNRGLAYYNKEEDDRAIADFDEALRIEPAYADAFFDRGLIYERRQDADHAIADYKAATANKPDFAEAFKRLGNVYGDTGDFDHAIAAFDQAIRLQPGNADYRNSRCWARVRANSNLDLARQDCDAALNISPGSAYILDSRALINLKQQRWQDAWNDYDAADRARPDHASYLFGRGVAALRLGRASQGQADIARAIQIDRAIAETFSGYGIVP